VFSVVPPDSADTVTTSVIVCSFEGAVRFSLKAGVVPEALLGLEEIGRPPVVSEPVMYHFTV